MKPADKDLWCRLKEAEKEVERHPIAGLRMKYVFHLDQLSQEEKNSIESHMATCERCRLEIEDTIARKDFFSRQKEPCD